MDLSDIDREGLLSPNCCTGSLLTALITLFSCAHCTTLHQPSLFPSPVYLFQHWCQFYSIRGLSQPGHENGHVPMSIDKCECQCQYEGKCGSMSVRGKKKRQKASPSRLLPPQWKKTDSLRLPLHFFSAFFIASNNRLLATGKSRRKAEYIISNTNVSWFLALYGHWSKNNTP